MKSNPSIKLGDRKESSENVAAKEQREHFKNSNLKKRDLPSCNTRFRKSLTCM